MSPTATSTAPADYADCYDPSWGRHKGRTRPVPGNHEYETPGAAGYFAYFGAAAGEPGEGWYSYELGGWHVVALNSSCEQLEGGCGADSPQVRWLRADLAAHPAHCTLAYWHHPRFGSAASERMRPAWRALYDAGAELVLSGDVHAYERLAPLDPLGQPDAERGIRQFVVGTGGAPLGEFAAGAQADVEVRHSGAHGVLELSLTPSGYAWEFVPAGGAAFTDSGSAACHNPPPTSSGVPPIGAPAAAAVGVPLAIGLTALAANDRRAGRRSVPARLLGWASTRARDLARAASAARR